jgi:ABC-type transporter Mla subunit MlaD
MSERALRFRLGIFVLLALVLLGAMVVMFGSFGTVRWFRRTTPYTVTFPEAPGIAPGTPIRRSGVRIGEVTDVALDDETGLVKVGIAIDKRFSIRQHEKPMLSTTVIGGYSIIDFVPQKQDPNKPPFSTGAVPAGETLTGEVQASIASLLSKASDVVPTTQELMNDIRKSLQTLERMGPTIDRTLNEFRSLAVDARTVIPEVKQTNEEVQKLVKSLNEIVPDVKKTAEEFRKLATTLTDVAPEVKETSKDLRKLINSANEAFPDIRKAIQEGQKFLASLNELMPELRKTNADVQGFIKQGTDLIPDVKTTVRDVGSAAQQYNKLGETLDKLVKDNQTKITRIIDNFGATLDRTLELLSNENRRNITDTIRNIRNATDKLPETMKNLDDAVKEGKATATRLRDSMTKADEVMAGLRDFTKALNERGPNLLRNLDESFDKINKITGDVRDLVRVIGESDGSFRRFLTDPALYNHIDDAMLTLSKAMPRVDRILKDVETFADKLARHPESIGLGGVVKPGSGLKDPPQAYPGRVVPPGR